MMLTHRTCAVVAPVEATVAHNVHAWLEHVGCADRAAEQAGLVKFLEEVDQNFVPPEAHCVIRYAVWKVPEQRRVLLIAADLFKQGMDTPRKKTAQSIDIARLHMLTQSIRRQVPDVGELEFDRSNVLLFGVTGARIQKDKPATGQ